MNERPQSLTSSRRSLAERLAASPSSPADWPRDQAWLEDAALGREALDAVRAILE
jgi:hypothetical protein